MVIFKYNGKVYKPENLERKLKKLGITINDVEILNNAEEKPKDDNIPYWKSEGMIKHIWVNINPNSNEFNYTIIGVHYPNEEVIQDKSLDWVYYDNIDNYININ